MTEKRKHLLSLESQLMNVEVMTKLEKLKFGSYYGNVSFTQESSKDGETQGLLRNRTLI